MRIVDSHALSKSEVYRSSAMVPSDRLKTVYGAVEQQSTVLRRADFLLESLEPRLMLLKRNWFDSRENRWRFVGTSLADVASGAPRLESGLPKGLGKDR